jgi:glutamine synthetase
MAAADGARGGDARGDALDLGSVTTFRAAACDLNGQLRGKRLPAAAAAKLGASGLRMPLSALNVDVWGSDIEGSPLVFETGDKDGVLFPTERGPVPMPWLDTPSALVPMWMFEEAGAPFAGDPRHALARALDAYRARGWQVRAATEMEFTLVDDSGAALRPPVNPQTGRRLQGHAILSIRQLDAFDAFFTDLYAGCDAMGIAVESAISEAGLGQFEITLGHRDAMAAADDAWLFKTLARGLARRHGMAATFLAKPYPDDAGNGMHVHFSVLDAEGRNVFDDGSAAGSDILRQAVAGCLRAMPDATLILAPHGPSYARLVPGAHAPTGAGWGYDNRTAAIRIPAGPRRDPRRGDLGRRGRPRAARAHRRQRLRARPAADGRRLGRGDRADRGLGADAADPRRDARRQPLHDEAPGDAAAGRNPARASLADLPRDRLTPCGRARRGLGQKRQSVISC